ncbi:acetate/propionate family kinase [methanotrophic endosymbiont of Bathymodiolus puteoserpentis (Logatchev)]|jgi:acetate kinase|uniref:acetate/propionate family kinase n=1 Tax=methanotrophic endosymbiont of Bathymodiolus puteoserpentis (Logatchev) TaxID=343235 RepID=UPI0013CDB989|nr:acetate kinase [methanotrophic endosymbiont of Bathymodiolus puteoserpentis (Logatchev)]SHE22276.1 Acetate kinase [methanotrophic endosymbiont of Bathymodiolus puteoserpentis (Logatchev)]
MKVLVLNSGSSSIKYALFDMDTQFAQIIGLIERIAESGSAHKYQYSSGGIEQKQIISLAINNHQQGLQAVFTLLSELNFIQDISDLFCIGHRVVHGGEKFCQPTLIDSTVLAEIKKMIPLAPLHNPANITGIEAAMVYAQSVPQVAVFDTAFHQTMPDYAFRYAVPTSWYAEQGVRRYGFHGTSHFYVAKQAAQYLNKPLNTLNLITLHLGNGASMAAIASGKSIDTTMGMTPLEGLMMGTRSGDLDPAIIFYLSRTLGFTQNEIDNALNKQSGLKGVCGENDMRAVHKMADKGDQQAQLALAMYSYRIKKYIGAYTAVLGRVDALVFTGGIGEHDAWLREQCCSDLSILGVEIDVEKNQQQQREINQVESLVKVLVIATNEELEIAQQAECCVR